MNFDLPEEVLDVRRLVRNFAEKEIVPVAEKYEREERYPREIVSKMGELGFFTSIFPEEYGGTAMEWGFLVNAVVAEELAKASLGFANVMNMQSTTVPLTILNWGTTEQKSKFIPSLIKCEFLGAFGLTEPQAASDSASLETTAREDGDCYVLNGSKIWITHASVMDVAVVFAKTVPGKRHDGITAFLVEKGTPGLGQRKIVNKLGVRSSDTGELFFEDCRVPKQNMLGPLNQGFQVAQNALQYGRTSVAARALGVAQACLDASLKYANEREQFGQKIGKFQMVQQLIADMKVEIEAARLLVYNSAWLKDMGRPNYLESTMAKFFAAESCVRASESACRIHGAYSYSDEFPVGRYYRDALLTIAGEGSSNIQRIIIANDVLGWKKRG